MQGYEIVKKNPEGWTRAYVVLWNGKEVAQFRYKDSAEYYIKEDRMQRNQK